MSRIPEALKRAEQERAQSRFANEAKPPDSLVPEVAHRDRAAWPAPGMGRSEEHTSELQSHLNLVCRLLLEKKKRTQRTAQPRPAPPGPSSRCGQCPARALRLTF